MTDRAGVYCIRNPKNKKMYIGSSKHVVNRLLEHLSQLENHIHSNQALQEAYDSGGLEYCILEYLPNSEDKDAILACEQKWIDYYNTVTCGYNKANPSRESSYRNKSPKISKPRLPHWARVCDELSKCDTMLSKIWRVIKVALFY